MDLSGDEAIRGRPAVEVEAHGAKARVAVESSKGNDKKHPAQEPRCFRRNQSGHFKSDCIAQTCPGCGGLGHGIDVCPSVQ